MARRTSASKSKLADEPAAGPAETASVKTAAPKSEPQAVPEAPPAPPPSTKLAGRLFSVTRSRGAGWDPALPLEEQADWPAHAAFMNGLESDGFVVLGGPLEDTHYTMLAVRAEDIMQVRSRLSEDPWEGSRLIETTRIVGWNLALGAGRI